MMKVREWIELLNTEKELRGEAVHNSVRRGKGAEELVSPKVRGSLDGWMEWHGLAGRSSMAYDDMTGHCWIYTRMKYDATAGNI